MTRASVAILSKNLVWLHIILKSFLIAKMVFRISGETQKKTRQQRMIPHTEKSLQCMRTQQFHNRLSGILWLMRRTYFSFGCHFLNRQRRSDTWQHPRSVVVADRR
nr:MAG TPA: hypothetical protein [Caudoviricetes sp.]